MLMTVPTKTTMATTMPAMSPAERSGPSFLSTAGVFRLRSSPGGAGVGVAEFDAGPDSANYEKSEAYSMWGIPIDSPDVEPVGTAIPKEFATLATSFAVHQS